MDMINKEGLEAKRAEWEGRDDRAGGWKINAEDVFHIGLNPTLAYSILRKDNGKYDVLCYFTVNKTWMVSLEGTNIEDPMVAMKKLCQRSF